MVRFLTTVARGARPKLKTIVGERGGVQDGRTRVARSAALVGLRTPHFLASRLLLVPKQEFGNEVQSLAQSHRIREIPLALHRKVSYIPHPLNYLLPPQDQGACGLDPGGSPMR